MSEESIAKQTFRHWRLFLYGAIVAGVLVYLASGVYSLKPEQTGVVKRFGAIVADNVPPGIHYHWPWPIEEIFRPNTREVRSVQLAFTKTIADTSGTHGGALLTGDENLVLLTLLLQYTLLDPARYLTTAANPDALLKQMTQAAVVRHFASMSVDDSLTTGKDRLQRSLREEVQKASNRLELGVAIVSLQIKAIEPPKNVAHAFKDVASAREDMHKMLQTANGEHNRKIPEARADAERMVLEAEAYAKEVVEIAKGDADRFLAKWEEYRKAKSVTAHRIYLETIEEILPKVKKQIINPKAEKNARGRPFR